MNAPPTSPGIFVISLDFELYWGMRDKKKLESYKENLTAVHTLVPRLLDLFRQYHIHATWATVGFLFFETRRQLLNSLPAVKPPYHNKRLSPYEYVSTIGENWQSDPYHYAPHLIRQIMATPGQEIGSHTFSHYYCLEPGQTTESFCHDLQAARTIAAQWQASFDSLVFPRNQYNGDHIDVCREMGITAYRGTESSWIYRSRQGRDETKVRRLLRLLDAYINLSGHNTYSLQTISQSYPYNISSSRFLRPYAPHLRFFESVRLERITRDLTHAAQTGEVYHLWWHPHNFGTHTDQNLANLQAILTHFRQLQRTNGMISLNMGEIADNLAAR